jgi:hypothetical protein
MPPDALRSGSSSLTKRVSRFGPFGQATPPPLCEMLRERSERQELAAGVSRQARGPVPIRRGIARASIVTIHTIAGGEFRHTVQRHQYLIRTPAVCAARGGAHRRCLTAVTPLRERSSSGDSARGDGACAARGARLACCRSAAKESSEASDLRGHSPCVFRSPEAPPEPATHRCNEEPHARDAPESGVSVCMGGACRVIRQPVHIPRLRWS